MNDPLYNFVDASLYKLSDSKPQAVSSIVNPENIDSGLSTGFSEVVAGGLKQGKHGFDNTETGFILGIDNGTAKFYIGNTTSYISWDGTTLSVVGGVDISSLNIPDSTTANSFHVDTTGNTWWGANVASGYTAANAYVLATGVAVFKNISIGGTSIQYTVSDNGNYTFGDGSDGTATFDGVGAVTGASLVGSTYTLTRDVYYTSATVSTGVTVKPAGYRIFGTGTLTLNGTATIQRNGNAGTAGTAGQTVAQGSAGGAGGGGGAALADGFLKGSLAGAAGGAGGDGIATAQTAGTVGSNGVNTTNSLGSNGVAGGAGTKGQYFSGTCQDALAGAAGGTAGTATATNVAIRYGWRLQDLLDSTSTGASIKCDNSASGSGGGGGGGGGNGATAGGGGGGGGGAGSAGGIIAIYFRAITVGASASITANGGAGGAGGAAGVNNSGASGGAGGGGAGGNGGQVVLVYNSLTNNGSITASAGAAGAGGTGSTDINCPTSDGAAGTAGTAGTVRQFTVSL